MRRSPHEILINVRIADVHVFLTKGLKLSFAVNEGHSFKVISWWPPETRSGEFRKSSSWSFFKVYRFFRWKP